MNIFYFSKIITIIIRGISNLILVRDRRRDHMSLVLISVVGGFSFRFGFMTMNCNISLHRSKHPRVDFLVEPWANRAQPVA